MPQAFTTQDTGCHIDGAFGEGHALRKMAALLRTLPPDPAVSALLAEYARTLGDDTEWLDGGAQEWLDDATNVLQANTEDGLIWTWYAGDLILTTESEATT